MFQGYGIPKLRRAIIRTLAEAYARDDLTLEDYERRVKAAEGARTVGDLDAIVEYFSDNSSDFRQKPAAPCPYPPVRTVMHPAVWLLPAGLLAIAPLPLPYGYFVLLRLVVCSAVGLLTYYDCRVRGRVSGWAITMAGIALLFNPLIPVHLTRDIWIPIDLSTALLIIFHLRSIKK